MADPLIGEVRETIRDYGMIHTGEAICVACSGGADSTALLLLLQELAEPLGCVLSVGHVNHCLRGAESDADEEFVRRLAERLKLPCWVERAEVGRLARESRANQEAYGRRLRLRFFQSLIAAGRADAVALAHTADDQAETVLYRLLRGTGTAGLSGIHPVVEGAGTGLKMIRPLLQSRRAAVRRWLAGRGESWREDSSNQDSRIVRNRIRQRLLPLLEEFNPRVVEVLAHTAAIAREEEEFWKSYLRPICQSAVRWEQQRAVLKLDTLRQLPAAAAFRLLRWTIGRVSAPGALDRLSQPRPTDYRHIRGLLRWALHGRSGQQFSLPQNVEARKEFEHLILEKREATGLPADRPELRYCYPVEVPGVVEIREVGRKFRFEFVRLDAGPAGYNEKGIILLDAKLADSPLSLRNWQAGDAYRPEGHRSQKKLQDLFQRKRIPVQERAGWPVLWAGDRIVWVAGFAAAAEASPPPDSSQAIGIFEVR